MVVLTTSVAGGGVGGRPPVAGGGRPPRPAASFVSHVRGVTVQITATRYGAHTPRVRHRTVTIGSPDQVGALVTAYNKLPGWPPFFHSCPMQLTQRRYRIVFHTAAGDVSASGPMSCYDTLTVRRDGRRVGPYLDLASDLLGLLPH